MKAALFAVAALLLAGPALGYIALGDNGMTTYSGRSREPNTVVFGNELMLQNAFDATASLAGSLLTGNWKPTPREPASPKKEVELSCLNSVAPPPLNWPMWCPGKDAKIVDWSDNHGALHRQITMRPIANVTSTMVMWFGSTYLGGLLPPVVEFEGNLYNYYHLWHPLDHVEHAWALGPSLPPFQIGNMYTLIHERYRNPADWPHKTHYETNGWFFLQDPIGNMMHNRFYITMPVLGLPSWSMIIELNDTPEGMVTEIEIILGVPPKGFDERDPTNGFLTAASLNELLVAPLVASQKGTPDFDAAVDSLTRHAIEEFGNLRFFLPVLYEKYNIMGHLGINWIPSPGDWMQHARNTFQLDLPALSMYDALAAVAQLQLDKSNSTFAAAVDSLVGASKSAFRSALDIADIVSTAESMIYTPHSNAVTAAAREINAAVGAQPEADISVQKLKRAMVGGNPNAWGTPWYLSWFTGGNGSTLTPVGSPSSNSNGLLGGGLNLNGLLGGGGGNNNPPNPLGGGLNGLLGGGLNGLLGGSGNNNGPLGGGLNLNGLLGGSGNNNGPLGGGLNLNGLLGGSGNNNGPLGGGLNLNGLLGGGGNNNNNLFAGSAGVARGDRRLLATQ